MGLAALIFGASLPPHFQSWSSAKRTNVAVRVELQELQPQAEIVIQRETSLYQTM
jgi:hypothetical protein